MEPICLKSEKRVMAMGFFDGVHVGHAALLACAKRRAAEIGARPSVLTFDVHPDQLVFRTQVKLIGDAGNRKEILSRCYGIDDVIFVHFGEHTRNMPWEQFAEYVVTELHAQWLVVGHDFTFGTGGEGNANKLKEWCFKREIGCDIIPAVTLDGRTVSSTYIRTLIRDGKINEANRFLGHPYCLSDTVRSGHHIGRKLFAPTINMYYPDGVVIPRFGVYATKVILPDGSEHMSVTNVGVRPSVSDENKVSVESHLFGFSGDLYDSPARVDYYSFIRPEKKFDSLDALGAQIRIDSENAKKYFHDF